MNLDKKPELILWRTEIDEIDQAIYKLLLRRLSVVENIVEYKLIQRMPTMLDREREREMFATLEQKIERDNLENEIGLKIKKIYKAIFSLSHLAFSHKFKTSQRLPSIKKGSALRKP